MAQGEITVSKKECFITQKAGRERRERCTATETYDMCCSDEEAHLELVVMRVKYGFKGTGKEGSEKKNFLSTDAQD